jgi:hypothetical protein
MQDEFFAQIIILDPVSIIIFGYLFYTLKRETKFYEEPKNLNSMAFVMKHPKYQCITTVNILSSAAGFIFFRSSGRLLSVSVTLSGVRA